MFKKLLNKVLNKKVVDLDNDGKIETLRMEIEGVFSQFKRMNERINTVNESLASVVEEETKVMEEAENRVASAKKEIEKNNKLKEKVQEIIV